MEALSHTGDSPTATPHSPWCACNLWALSHSPRERTHVSHGKQREQDTEWLHNGFCEKALQFTGILQEAGPLKPKPGSHLWKKSSMTEPLWHTNRPKFPIKAPTVPSTIPAGDPHWVWTLHQPLQYPCLLSHIYFYYITILQITYIICIFICYMYTILCYILYIHIYVYITSLAYNTLHISSPLSHEDAICLFFPRNCIWT